MPDGVHPVSSSLQALAEQYRTITDNLANANTPGFKRQRVSFAQTLSQAVAGSTESTPPTGNISARSALDFSQGSLTQTGATLDLALEGKGFFVIKTLEGDLYTRCGKFRVDGQRQIVDPSGRIVAGTGGGPIVLPASRSTSDLHVSQNGTVHAGGAPVGRLEIVDFDDLSVLTQKSNGCFQAADGAEPQDAEAPCVRQGFVEGSNVSLVDELVGLITVTRLYEANVKSISVQDEQMKTILQVAMS